MIPRKTRNERLLALFMVGLFLATPLALIVYQAVAGLSQNIRLGNDEQAGIACNDFLLDLIIDVQNLRLRAAPGQTESLRENLSRTEDAFAAPGALRELRPVWHALRQDMEAFAAHPGGAADETAARLVRGLRQMMDDVSDHAGITTDRALDTSYLAGIIVRALPDVAVTSGNLAAAAAGGAKTGALLAALDTDEDALAQALSRVQREDETSARFTAAYDAAARPLLGRLRAAAAAPRQDAAVHLSGLLRALDALNDDVTREFIERLRAHVAEEALKKRLVAGSGAVALAGFAALFAFLYKSLLRTERAERAAVAANLAKSEFLANMSHELRTPLNSILGMLRLLTESGGLGERQQELADVAFQSSTGLLATVNDILDISKIEAGEMKLESIGFDPQCVLHSVVHVMDPLAREKRVPIVRHYEKAELPCLVGDPMRLTGVLTNLIGNAVKYTSRGHIDVSATCVPTGEGRVSLILEVADTGIGIPADKRAAIFEKFVQGDASTTRRYGGTGLGLAITRQVVKMMGGAISVESELGLGSTFRVVIPFPTTDRPDETPSARSRGGAAGTLPAEKARVLVAEDHPMNQLFIRRVLEKFGVGHVEVAADGLAALEACKQGGWDAILMDCHMPEKNGYETAREIRTLEKRIGGHTPIVAMTANAMIGDREKCLRYGMDEYVSKPVNIDILKEVLSRWIAFPDEGGAPAAVDLSRLRAFTGGDAAAERELTEIFLRQSDENLAALAAACDGGESGAWRDTAHMLKGGAAGIGADALAALCGKGQNFTGTEEERRALLAQIGAEYARVRRVLQPLSAFPLPQNSL